MAEPRIELRHVWREFRGGAGVHGVDLSIAAGEVHALVGLNGAGKTTLMRLMLGMLHPSAGEVFIDGLRIDALPTTAWAGVGQFVENALAYGELWVDASRPRRRHTSQASIGCGHGARARVRETSTQPPSPRRPIDGQ